MEEYKNFKLATFKNSPRGTQFFRRFLGIIFAIAIFLIISQDFNLSITTKVIISVVIALLLYFLIPLSWWNRFSRLTIRPSSPADVSKRNLKILIIIVLLIAVALFTLIRFSY